MSKQKIGEPRYFIKCRDCGKESGYFRYKSNIGKPEDGKKSKLFSGCEDHQLAIEKTNL